MLKVKNKAAQFQIEKLFHKHIQKAGKKSIWNKMEWNIKMQEKEKSNWTAYI